MKYILLSFVIIIAFLGISCQKKQAPVILLSGDITGKEWRLAKWSRNDVNPADYTITATFNAEYISGKSAVNQYNGPYTLSKNNDFSVGTLIITRMAGSPDAMKAEQIYQELLGKAKKYSIDVSGLTLLDNEGTELLFFVPS